MDRKSGSGERLKENINVHMHAVAYSLCDYVCMYMHVYDFVCLKQTCLSLLTVQ